MPLAVVETQVHTFDVLSNTVSAPLCFDAGAVNTVALLQVNAGSRSNDVAGIARAIAVDIAVSA